MRFVDSYSKKVIYTNENHLITLQFPFILNINNYLFNGKKCHFFHRDELENFYCPSDSEGNDRFESPSR